jgi:hypothetical protein
MKDPCDNEEEDRKVNVVLKEAGIPFEIRRTHGGTLLKQQITRHKARQAAQDLRQFGFGRMEKEAAIIFLEALDYCATSMPCHIGRCPTCGAVGDGTLAD